MTMRPEKLAVLMALRQQQELVSLPALLEKLGEDFAERTVRRWLNEMVADGLVIKTGQKRATQYQAKVSPEIEKGINYITRPLYERNPVTYNREWLQSYIPNESAYVPKDLQNHLYQHGQRAFNKDPAGTYARKIYQRLLIDLSYNSSRLEGNTYTLLETKKLLLEGEAQADKLDEERVMILNHKEAIRHLIDNAAKIQIDFREICTLHYLLADGLVPNQYAGKLRDHGVRIGESAYIPLDNKDQLTTQLNEICSKANLIEHPIEQCFFVLTHIAYLQAFTDVNKRTSRLSANIPLIKSNCVPLSFNHIDKQQYISALLVIYELNDVSLLLELFASSYLNTCDDYNVTVESFGIDAVRVRYRQQRRDIIREIVRNQLTSSNMMAFIDKQTKRLIPTNDQESFKNNVLEDLKLLSIERIAGMGITKEQLEKWLVIGANKY